MDEERREEQQEQQSGPDPDELQSLRDELAQLRGELSSAREELSKTKQLNFTLARQIDVSREKAPAIEAQIDALFGKRPERG